MAIEELKIDLERSFALDDSCQMMFWAKGHHTWGNFISAIEVELLAEERDDIPLWVISQAPFKQTYQRSVPCSGSIVADRQFVYQDQPGRGATPVTILDIWLPIHRPQKQQASTKEALAEVEGLPKLPLGFVTVTEAGHPDHELRGLFLVIHKDHDLYPIALCRYGPEVDGEHNVVGHAWQEEVEDDEGNGNTYIRDVVAYLPVNLGYSGTEMIELRRLLKEFVQKGAS